MRECTPSKRFFYRFLFFYLLVILGLIIYIPFTQPEYHILQKSGSLTALIAQTLFGYTQNYIIVRLFFFFIALSSLYILYEISKEYLKKEYRYLALILYLLTPGVFVSFVIVNFALFPIFFSLLFVYAYLKRNIFMEVLALVLLFFTDTPIFFFYFALSIFSFIKKEWIVFAIGVFLFSLSLVNMRDFISGVPKGHLVELFISYAVLFSPFYFIALLYALYRLAKEKKYFVLWSISASFLIFSLLLSIRQKVHITQFAPFIVIFTPLLVYVFQESISIRLKRFQKWHIKVCQVVVATLLIESGLIALSYPIYQFSDHKIKVINSRIYTINYLKK